MGLYVCMLCVCMLCMALSALCSSTPLFQQLCLFIHHVHTPCPPPRAGWIPPRTCSYAPGACRTPGAAPTHDASSRGTGAHTGGDHCCGRGTQGHAGVVGYGLYAAVWRGCVVWLCVHYNAPMHAHVLHCWHSLQTHSTNTAHILHDANPFPTQHTQVAVTTFADATVAVELSLSQALVQWPYTQEMSMVDALAEIFQPLPVCVVCVVCRTGFVLVLLLIHGGWRGGGMYTNVYTTISMLDYHMIVNPHHHCQSQKPGLDANPPQPVPQLATWVYINVILTDSHVFAPVFDVVCC